MISVLQIAPVAVSDAAMLAPEEIFEGKGDIKEEGELTQAERKRRRANKKRRYAGTFHRPFREDFWPSFTLWLLLRTLFNLLSHLFKLSIKMVFVFPFKMQDHTRRGQPSCRKIRPNVCESTAAHMPLFYPKSPNIELERG